MCIILKQSWQSTVTFQSLDLYLKNKNNNKKSLNCVSHLQIHFSTIVKFRKSSNKCFSFFKADSFMHNYKYRQSVVKQIIYRK